MKTEAFVLREIGKPMQLESVFLDDPNDDEVLVAIVAAGLCRSDLHSINGHDGTPLPIVLGHEAVGIVEKKGANVVGLEIGQRVVLSWMPECGVCRACRRGRPALCSVADNCFVTGELPGGGVRLHDKNRMPIHHYSSVASFARHAIIPSNGCIPLQEKSISSESAAAIGCATMTGVGAAVKTAKVKPGESVAVFGLGGVGLNVLQGARLAGASVIIGIDPNVNKRDLSHKFGATHFVNANEKNLNRVIADICNGVDVAFDAIGYPDVIRAAFDSAASGGRIICVGLSPGELEFRLPINAFIGAEKSIFGCYYGGTNPTIDFPMLIDLFRHGRILLNELVEEVIPFEGIADGFSRMQAGTLLGRLVAKMD